MICVGQVKAHVHVRKIGEVNKRVQQKDGGGYTIRPKDKMIWNYQSLQKHAKDYREEESLVFGRVSIQDPAGEATVQVLRERQLVKVLVMIFQKEICWDKGGSVFGVNF
jgi:hypothetical protein